MKYKKSRRLPDPEESKEMTKELKEFEQEVVYAGQTLKLLREKNAMTIDQLSEITGLDAHLLEKMEQGQQPIPFEISQSFAKIFDVDHKQFM